MRMKPFKSHGMNRVIARGATHMVNDISRMQEYNKRLKGEVYASDDDTFYKTYSNFPRSEIKNRYILQRLKEIELKKNCVTDNSEVGVIMGFIIALIIFILIMAIIAISN